ncbi:hypothetical protein EDB85DRAFT_108907 [Lactarius pseudohatsudake]|nr:hypothetical protein EDB85DRAFT_108907 [Lactarius pseudohatsudake]
MALPATPCDRLQSSTQCQATGHWSSCVDQVGTSRPRTHYSKSPTPTHLLSSICPFSHLLHESCLYARSQASRRNGQTKTTMLPIGHWVSLRSFAFGQLSCVRVLGTEHRRGRWRDHAIMTALSFPTPAAGPNVRPQVLSCLAALDFEHCPDELSKIENRKTCILPHMHPLRFSTFYPLCTHAHVRKPFKTAHAKIPHPA